MMQSFLNAVFVIGFLKDKKKKSMATSQESVGGDMKSRAAYTAKGIAC